MVPSSVFPNPDSPLAFEQPSCRAARRPLWLLRERASHRTVAGQQRRLRESCAIRSVTPPRQGGYPVWMPRSRRFRPSYLLAMLGAAAACRSNAVAILENPDHCFILVAAPGVVAAGHRGHADDTRGVQRAG